MPTQPFAAQPKIDIGGRTFEEAGGAELVEVIVDTDLTASTSCTITLLDAERGALTGVDYGTPVSVKAPGVNDGELLDLFTGEVYAMEFESDERGTYSRLTAFDQSYRLKQHRVTKAHISVTDSDVASAIANEVGLKTGTVDATTIVHEHLGQFNETHWEFLRSRASANDFEVFVSGGELHFRKPDDATSGPQPGGNGSTDPLQLTSGRNLVHLRTRVSAAEQVAEVEVRGWNPQEKIELVGIAPASSNAAELSETAAGLAGKLGSPSQVTGRADFSTQAQCDALAASIAQRTASCFAYAEGTALGDPRLVAGVAVAIGEVGPFDGQYTLTRARHVFRPGDYSTYFTVSGNHDRTRFGMAHGRDAAQRWVGSYPALVTNLKDPNQAGRVKLSFPWLDESYESDWARVTQIGAGAEEGILWYPEVGDEVLVSFLAGDPRHPVVHGGMYNGVDLPPFADHIDTGKGTVEVRGMKSRAGHQLSFHDAEGDERIEIRTASGAISIVLSDKERAIIIETDGELKLKTGAAVTIDGSSDVTVKGSSNITIEAGANAEIKAGGSLKLSAGGTVEISGALVKLN